MMMTPNITSQALLLAAETNDDDDVVKGGKTCTTEIFQDNVKEKYEWKISWRNVFGFIYLHGGFFYAIYLIGSGQAKLFTTLWNVSLGLCAALGVTAGAHRLWAHKSYKAKWPMRLLLVIFQTMAFQNDIYEWVRDHRVHHKFVDTNADPHNIKRGFFFSHMGWLLIRKHPDVKTKGKTVDMSDLEEDPIVIWQRRTYLIVMPLLCFVMPTLVPYYLVNETFWNAWYISIFRYMLSLHITWLVNSAAHIWGVKPYDKNISSSENATVGILAMGEGWHNYHHVFPWDYKAAELGNYNVNVTTGFIDLCAKIGWAYDLKSVSREIIEKRAKRTGDGTLKHSTDPNHHMNNVWGWGDKDMTSDDVNSMTGRGGMNYASKKKT
ncbi:fatty acid desaturase, putative [Pediculus humanus corporis]|uniref:Fatty acid desaturase, putative n=1 Tax=Pediculus humanus subsp. corporis TaxID=121224 RepID=E0VE45_PEDHC|nr:fatty acid desaturase, putative [Pediculus humanus corporis]EEB11651.1 fatty acid desaturase, putative [Pediculus humanus corporis]